MIWLTIYAIGWLVTFLGAYWIISEDADEEAPAGALAFIIGIMWPFMLPWLAYNWFVSMGKDESPAICVRCGHDAEKHWYPDTKVTTTACVECLARGYESKWTAGDGYSRTGICDHTAEWVRLPW